MGKIVNINPENPQEGFAEARKHKGDGRSGYYEYVPDYAEDKLAQKVVERYSANIRYVENWNKWFIWDGACCREDDKGQIIDKYVRDVCGEKSNEIAQENRKTAKTLAAKLLSSATIHSVRRLTQSIAPVAASVDQWDKDPWLLNTPGGVVDLKTGEMREHRPDDYMTKMTAVAPDRNCPTRLFNSFFAESVEKRRRLYCLLETHVWICAYWRCERACDQFRIWYRPQREGHAVKYHWRDDG